MIEKVVIRCKHYEEVKADVVVKELYHEFCCFLPIAKINMYPLMVL